MIPFDALPKLPEPAPLPKLGPPPRMRNYLLKFESQRGQNEWLTVYASGDDEVIALAIKVEERLSWKFKYDWEEL